MKILQNVACIQAIISPSDKRISLNKDILRGKKLLSIYLFSSTANYIINSPYNPDNAIAAIDSIDPLSLYLNLIDNSGNQIIKDFSFKNLILTTENNIAQHYIEYGINRVLDLDQSYITYKGTTEDEIPVLVYVLYQTENFTKFADEINGSITFQMPVISAIQDIQLKEIVNYTLANKQIKQIIISNPNDNPVLGYLDLRCKNRILENIPAVLFQNHSAKEMRLDNIKIDFEKSYYRNRDTQINPFDITFIY